MKDMESGRNVGTGYLLLSPSAQWEWTLRWRWWTFLRPWHAREINNVFFRYRREYFTFFLSFIVVRFYTCIKLKLFGLSSYHILMFILNGFVLHSVYVPAVVNGHHVDGRDVNAQKGETECISKTQVCWPFLFSVPGGE